MNNYYSPSEQKFYQSSKLIGDWVLADTPFSDWPWTVVSQFEQENENGIMVTYYAFDVDEGSKAEALAEMAAMQDALAGYEQLNKEILADGAATSGTTNVLSSIVDMLTYQRMFDRPELFDSEDLVAKKAVGSFAQGDPLDTDLKVRQYAELMLAETDAFMIRRLKKITDYILGG